MKIFDLNLYLVLDAAVCGARLLETAQAALASGVTMLQLRGHKTAWGKREWYEAALALKPLCAQDGVPFIINDQVDIALAVDADGVHVGQGDLPLFVVRRVLGEDKIIGLSTHNVAQVQAANGSGADYIGMGPVFATRSKADAQAPIGLDGLQAMVAAKSLPGVAIGGIDAKNSAAVRAVNSDGIAVISAICGQADVAAATRALCAG